MLVEAREANNENDGKYSSRKGCEFCMSGCGSFADEMIRRA